MSMTTFPAAGPTAPVPMTINSQPDAADWLPAECADKLRALRREAEDRHAVIPSFERRNELANSKVEAEQRLHRLLDRQSGFGLKLDDEQVVFAERQVEKCTDEFDRLEKLYAERSAHWQEAAQVLHRCESWLRSQNGTLEPYDGAEPAVAPGENIVAAIATLRQRASELRNARARIANAPLPASVVKARLRAEVEALAARGKPSLRRDGDITWPMTMQQVAVQGAPGAVGFAEHADAMAVLCWVQRDAILAKLDGLVAPDTKDTLSTAERERQESKLSAELLMAERDLAAMVWRAKREMLPVEFDAEISVAAVLGCEAVAVQTTHQSGSSPGWSFGVVR